MKDIKKVIIISDLHIGGDTEAKDLDLITEFLCDDTRFENASLVIAGDMLDGWAHTKDKVPPSYKEIIKNNKFWIALSKRAEKTPVYYINGNHDFDLSIADLEENSPIIQLKPEELLTRFDNELYIDHGNCVDLFNATGHSDDGGIPYPLGYFKTRLHHTGISNQAPMQTDFYLNDAKADVIRILHSLNDTKLDQISELDELLNSISRILLDGMRKDIQSTFTGVNLKDIECLMPEGSLFPSYNFQEILLNYTGFVSRFYHNILIPSIGYSDRDPLDVPWDALIRSIDVIRTGGLSWYAKNIATRKNVLAVVFGHTHMNQIDNVPLTKNNGIIYANSGCWCKNSFGPNVTSLTYDFETMKITSTNETLTL